VAKGHRKTQSTAKNVDAAWKRIQRRMERFPFLPVDPARCVWDDDLRFTAADARSKLTPDDVSEHGSDLRVVQAGLGRIPPLPGRAQRHGNPFIDEA
jgi:hypothetical protein